MAASEKAIHSQLDPPLHAAVVLGASQMLHAFHRYGQPATFVMAAAQADGMLSLRFNHWSTSCGAARQHKADLSDAQLQIQVGQQHQHKQ